MFRYLVIVALIAAGIYELFAGDQTRGLIFLLYAKVLEVELELEKVPKKDK